MRIETNQERAVISGAEIKNFGVHIDSSVYVQMLTKWYAGVEGSVIRELLSNAQDACIEAGTDKRPVIGIIDNNLFVHDFGNGLSPDFMNNNIEQEYEDEFGNKRIIKVGYLTIGHSTKKNSDDQLGFFGVGRISALAYTTQYLVQTVYQGIEYEYLIFLDGNTIKQSLLSQKETEYPSGTRIVVPILKDYYALSRWKEAIKKQAAYFEGTTIDESIFGNKVVVEVEKDGIIRKSNLLNYETHIVFGNVFYSTPWKEFREWEFLDSLNVGIYIGLTEGLVPTPSRESFQLTEGSKQLLLSKFSTIAEQLYESTSAKWLTLDKNILKLKCHYEGNINGISLANYKFICTTLGKLSVNMDIPYVKNYWSTYSALREMFTGNYGVFLKKSSALQKTYLKQVGKQLVKQKPQKSFSYIEPYFIADTIEEKVKLFENLVQEYIEVTFEKFDQVEFEQWKKEREPEKKTGIKYYRNSHRDPDVPILETGHINLNRYRYIFKCSKPTAQKYWVFLKSLNLDMIVTQDQGYDLDKLEPSPFLRRLCSEALKTQIYNKVGAHVFKQDVLYAIKKVNPLLAKYIKELNFDTCGSIDSESVEGLIEAGNLLNCFNHNETKLKYVSKELDKLKVVKHLASNRYSMSVQDMNLIKRVYILEKLAEKKFKYDIDQITFNDENQTTEIDESMHH